MHELAAVGTAVVSAAAIAVLRARRHATTYRAETQRRVWHACRIGDASGLAVLLQQAVGRRPGGGRSLAAALVNAEGKRGQTPLYLAGHGGHEACVTLLIEHGARITCRGLDSASDGCRRVMHRLAPEQCHRQRGTGAELLYFGEDSGSVDACAHANARREERRRQRRQQRQRDRGRRRERKDAWRRRQQGQLRHAQRAAGGSNGSGNGSGNGDGADADADAVAVTVTVAGAGAGAGLRHGAVGRTHGIAALRRGLDGAEWEALFSALENEHELEHDRDREREREPGRECGCGTGSRAENQVEAPVLGAASDPVLRQEPSKERQLLQPILRERQALRSIDLRKTRLGVSGAQRLARLLGAGGVSWLRHLFLFRCALGDAGVIALAAALRSDAVAVRNLRLNLCENQITATGAAALGDTLAWGGGLAACEGAGDFKGEGQSSGEGEVDGDSKNQGQRSAVLEALDMNNNELGDAGAAALAAGLACNRGLTQLSLWSNGLRDAGAEALAIALQRNRAHSLSRLNVRPGGHNTNDVSCEQQNRLSCQLAARAMKADGPLGSGNDGAVGALFTL